MNATDALTRGREAFARKAWAEAYTLLSAADAETSLAPEDVEADLEARTSGLHDEKIDGFNREVESLVAQMDVVRYRPLLLVLAAGKTASSLGSLAFFLIQDQVFIYLLNFLVDGFLALLALYLWMLAGRIGRPVEPG